MSKNDSTSPLSPGQRFGLWSVVGPDQERPGFVVCKCECGTVRPVWMRNLVGNLSQTCGCANRKRLKENPPGMKHEHTKHHLYGTWVKMLDRCENVSNSHYKWYGGRGIKVCDRWRESFVAFARDMGDRPKGGYTLDRIDNNGPYSPDNCRWATAKQQANNKDHNHLVTFRGRTQTVTQWAEEIGITESALRCRLGRLGWPLDKAMTTPGSGPQYRRRCASRAEVTAV